MMTARQIPDGGNERRIVVRTPPELSVGDEIGDRPHPVESFLAMLLREGVFQAESKL
jgi:hypothetical protein